jgi:hypothetical protein
MKLEINVFLIAVLLVAGLSTSAQAQRAFAGKYDLLSGYTRGELSGLFAYGIATVARNGNISYTSYYPYYDETYRGRGRMTKNGVFSFTNGVSGSARLVSKRVAVGNYRDPWGRGFFAVRKK